MAFHDTQYLSLGKKILDDGTKKQNRTGIPTTSIFGTELRFDLRDGTIPLLTTKKMHWPSIVHELLWYFSGSTNVKYLQDNGVRIWNEWANAEGDLGPLYGKMLRDWDGIDQLQDLINTMKTDPDSRRMVVSYWNPSVLPDSSIPPKDNPSKGLQALAPCHFTWQVYTFVEDGVRRASLKLTQRSADYFLGVPYNISQYSIILRILCHLTGMQPGEFIWSGGDTHIYENHEEQLITQLGREPFESPILTISENVTSVDAIAFGDLTLSDFQSHAQLKGAVAV